jgi:hypothetical protein
MVVEFDRKIDAHIRGHRPEMTALADDSPIDLDRRPRQPVAVLDLDLALTLGQVKGPGSSRVRVAVHFLNVGHRMRMRKPSPRGCTVSGQA